MYGNGIQGYRMTNVMTADPNRLVLMCYEGAIDNLKIVKQGLIEKDYERKGNAIKKAQDIIEELLCSLNFEKGGDVAKGLDSLYNYMLRRLLDADIKRDIKAIDEVIGILDELKSAWEEIFNKQDKEGIKPEIAGYREERPQSAASGYVSV